MPTETVAQGVLIGERLVPFPKSISTEARNFLAAMVDADGRPLSIDMPYPEPNDIAGWNALKRLVNEHMSKMFASQAALLKSACNTIEMRGVIVQLAIPDGGSTRANCAFLDMHGGALIYGEGEFCRYSARRHADNLGVCVYGVDYRNPPEHPYPAALTDCISVYRALLEKYPPNNIIMGGLSAGGNLAAATILRARDEGLPLPAAVVLQTPEVDLTESGDSFQTLAGLDVAPSVPVMPINLLYAAGHNLEHPYLSPLFGDFTKGFPPTFLQGGTRDELLSNTVRFHRALRRANVPAELHVFEAMPHGGFQGAPEDLELAAEIRRFADQYWEPFDR